jgi:FkbM family methyltransferase
MQSGRRWRFLSFSEKVEFSDGGYRHYTLAVSPSSQETLMLKSPLGHLNNLIERISGLRLQPSAEKRLSASRNEIFKNSESQLVIDVGANQGQWSSSIRKSGYKGKIISFEPTEAFAQLENSASLDSSWKVRKKALGSEIGKKTIFLASNKAMSSSLLVPTGMRERRPDIAFESGPSVEVSTLEAEIGAAGEDFYLKIDTQGFEMDVLRGAENILDRCVAIEFESAITPLYEGETLHHDIAQWLAEREFIPYQLVITDWDSNLRTVALDAIFVREKK